MGVSQGILCHVPNSLESQKAQCLPGGESGVPRLEMTEVGCKEL